MHKDFKRADEWTRIVIGAAIEVHRLKGPGLLEDIYERCLLRELELRGVPAATQIQVPVEYKGLVFENPLRLDVMVDGCLVVELKSVEVVLPIHKAQVLSYMKLLDAPLGLLINFSVEVLHTGVSRLVLRGADSDESRVDF